MSRIQDSSLLLAGAGVETYLAFVQRFPMREFCAFEVFLHSEELAKLEEDVLRPTAEAADEHGHDLLLDTLVWRAHSDFVKALGYEDDGVERFNRMAVERTRDFAERWQRERRQQGISESTGAIYLNGDVGPRGDGYVLEGAMTAEDAKRYHQVQIRALADAGIDAISALTMTSVAESVGIARAAQEVGVPCVVSPTVETDGRTPEGLSLAEFIEGVERGTNASPLFYMVNCAHPIHLEPALRRARDAGESWLERFRGFRANASHESHAELDNSPTLDRGQPKALGSQMAHLQADFGLCLVGGCCGTDAEHLRHMAADVGTVSTRAPHN